MRQGSSVADPNNQIRIVMKGGDCMSHLAAALLFIGSLTVPRSVAYPASAAVFCVCHPHPASATPSLKDACDYALYALGLEETYTVRLVGGRGLGAYDEVAHQVLLRRAWFEQATFEERVDVLFHELRHAYQYAVVAGKVDNAHRDLWAYNLDHYTFPSESSIGYLQQPVERDARQWAALATDQYLKR